jgi:hypothetical protein
MALIFLAVAAGLFFLARIAVKRPRGDNWGGIVMAFAIMSGVTALILLIVSIGSLVGAKNYVVEIRSSVSRFTVLLKDGNEKVKNAANPNEAINTINSTIEKYKDEMSVYNSLVNKAVGPGKELSVEKFQKMIQPGSDSSIPIDGKIKAVIDFTNSINEAIVKFAKDATGSAEMKDSYSKFKALLK